jgi:clan AA aspartic protease (TIGR02281 family)
MSWLARIAGLVLLPIALAIALVPFVELVGLGVHRKAASLAVSLTAILLVATPALAATVVAHRGRPIVFPLTLALWSGALFASLPVYFPGERREAVATGLAVLGLGSGLFGLSDRIVEALPEEPAWATAEVDLAPPLTVVAPPPPAPLDEHEIALPYEGEGRRLSVRVTFGNAETEREVDMMLDTGATYTTLSGEILAALGIRPSDDDPEIELHTANGDRTARIVLVDHVWLGDLRVDGVAIATCDDCASTDNAGLLGLNVAGGFNLSIDGDRREVVFTRRARFDRSLDVKPFVDLDATFVRVGGRVEADVRLENHSRRTIQSATAVVGCGSSEWAVEFPAVPPGVVMDAGRRLAPHEPCERYEIGLHEATW